MVVKAQVVIRCQNADVRSANTERAYRADWADFSGWCAERGLCPLPASPGEITSYIADLATRVRATTVRRRLAAIAAHHRDAGLSSPTADLAVKVGAARAERDLRSLSHPTTPLGLGELQALVGALPGTVAGIRDRAIVLLGVGAGLRRSELASLLVSDVGVRSGGLVVSVRDNAGAVRRKAFVPPGSSPATDAPSAWAAWLAVSGVVAGPAFRAVDRHGNIGGRRLSDTGHAALVKRALVPAGLDPARYGIGSLRRGLVLMAARSGVTDTGIAAQTGLKTLALVREYMRQDDIDRMVEGATVPSARSRLGPSPQEAVRT
jgi:integrase